VLATTNHATTDGGKQTGAPHATVRLLQASYTTPHLAERVAHEENPAHTRCVGDVEPAVQLKPVAHTPEQVADVRRAELPNVPYGHGSGAMEARVQYVPGMQGAEHDSLVRPSLAPYTPGGHDRHADLDVMLLNSPTLQLTNDEAPSRQ
jgi:hypothetical protein